MNTTYRRPQPESRLERRLAQLLPLTSTRSGGLRVDVMSSDAPVVLVDCK